MGKGEYLQYGGQAVMEGVMMRSPKNFAVAVRAPNGQIVLHAEPMEKTWIGRQKWLQLPFLRGTWGILDALTLGTRAMRFASKVLMDPKYQAPDDQPAEDKKQSIIESNETFRNMAVFGTIVVSFAFAFFLFKYVPNFIALQFENAGVKSFVWINFITEVIKIIFLFAYLLLIRRMPEIMRVFQYHGAEHKAINALEAEMELTKENCIAQTRLHPRCGTSFIIVVALVEMLLLTFIEKPVVSTNTVVQSIARFGFDLCFIPLIAGISYEMIRLAGKLRNSKFVMALFVPGLMTQYITTAEPDEEQIEVAMVALQSVIDADNTLATPS